MGERLDASFLDDALSFASRETKRRVSDALACHLHNTGYQLEGNTEANDVEWFARTIWADLNYDVPGRWDRIDEQQRAHYRGIASVVISALPAFQLRVAHRLIALSKVTRDMGRALRASSPSPERPE